MKDRLAALKAIINTGPNDVEVTIETGSLFMADFHEKCQWIETNVENIRTQIEDIKKLHATILSQPVIDEKIKKELDERMNQTNTSTKEIKLKLKGIETEIEALNLEKLENAEARIKKSQFNYLSHIFRSIMIQFNLMQVEYRNNCKERLARQLEIAGKSTTEEEIDRLLETGNTQIFTEGILMETKLAQQTLNDIQERHKIIINLEKSIKELVDMFNEMAILVANQGELIDNIEKNISNTVDYVQTAKKETEKAVVLQSKARRKKIILIVVLIAVVLIIIAILVGTLYSKFK